MKRTVDHIFHLSPPEVVEAFRWYLTYKQLRMPDDDKRWVMDPAYPKVDLLGHQGALCAAH
jgi:hypothetical protein